MLPFRRLVEDQSHLRLPRPLLIWSQPSSAIALTFLLGRVFPGPRETRMLVDSERRYGLYIGSSVLYRVGYRSCTLSVQSWADGRA